MGKVSVVIPCYNVEQYISECLDSVINQTYKNLEIICINDGSVDNTLNILNKYAEKDSRLIVIDSANKGVSNARNIGIEKASGEFLTFIDSDDYFEYDCIEKCVLEMRAKNADILCFGLLEVHGSLKKTRFDFELLQNYKKEKTLPDEVLKQLMLNACGKMYKLDFIVNNNIKFPLSIKTCEDGVFCLFCLYKNPKITLLDENFYNYRIRKGSACGSGQSLVKTDIEAFMHIILSEEFKSAKDNYKKITIEKSLLHFNWNDLPQNRLKNNFYISNFKHFLKNNVDKEILKKCNLEGFKKYTIIRPLLEFCFSVRNAGVHKCIKILGISIKFKNKKLLNKKSNVIRVENGE